jgi:ligand-binding sensor domain-containing protein
VSSARFFSITEDQKGNFWFGTIGEGAYYYNGKTFTHFTTKQGLLNNEVTSICEDIKGNIWFGVSGGASCYNGNYFRNYILDGNAIYEAFTSKTFPESQPVGVQQIMLSKNGTLWFGTKGALFTFDGDTFTAVKNKAGEAFANVWGITEDQKGTIWFGAEDGLYRYDGHSCTRFSERGALSILEDKKGNIWTSSTTAMYNKPWTLSCYDKKSLSTEKPTATEISSKQLIFGMLEAVDGTIWFGTGHGVCRYNGKTVMDFKEKQGDY